MPVGAFLALAVLSGALAIFGAALKALNWTVDAVRGSMLNGMVTGIRVWDDRSRRSPTGSAVSSPTGVSPFTEILETEGGGAVDVEPVTSRFCKQRT
jgi:hypothetical protein